MMDKKILKIIEERERRKCLSHLQSQAESNGDIPRMPFLYLRKLLKPLQYTGGILLGLYAGLFSVIINYFIIVLLFHM